MLHSPKRFEEWLPAGFDGLFGWDFLKMAFNGTKIMPMDFDAVVERNGNFLVFETKEKGKKIDLGQAITLTTVWKSKGFSVIHVEGKTAPEITGFTIYSGKENPKDGMIGDREIKPQNAVDLVYVVRRWFCMADGITAPTRDEWDRQIWVEDYDSTELCYGDSK